MFILRRLAATRKPPQADEGTEDPNARKAQRTAARELLWRDHGIFRTFWTNFAQIAPDAYRSNHPTAGRLKIYADLGIKAIINLRGEPKKPFQMIEVAGCRDLGIALHSIALHARYAPQRERLLALFDLFDTVERPFLLHCKSGADRAGLASALYLLDQGEPIAAARKQLSVKFLHLSFTRTGIQDMFLDMFAEDHARTRVDIREWVATTYDAQTLKEKFTAKWTLPV